MKAFTLILGLLVSAQSFANTTLICNDQNSHSVYELTVLNNLSVAQVNTLMGDSSVLAAGTKNLTLVALESVSGSALFSGLTNKDVEISITFNSKKMMNLKKYEILEVDVAYTNGETSLLCSRN